MGIIHNPNMTPKCAFSFTSFQLFILFHNLCIWKDLFLFFLLVRFCSPYYFQASLSETEKNADTAERQLRSTLREILIMEAEMENLQRGTGALRSRCTSISVENTWLQVNIREQEEEAAVALEGFAAYRNKMQTHRVATALAACQTQEYKALEESRALVRRLTQQREELRENLDKGNTARREKVEKGEQNTTCQGENLNT